MPLGAGPLPVTSPRPLPVSRRSRRPAPTLEELVSAAAQSNSDTISPALADQLRAQELYVRVEQDSAQTRFVTSAVQGADGLLQVYTDRSRAGMTYAGMRWEAIVDAVNSSPGLRGVHVINAADDWIFLDHPALQALS